MMTQFEVWDADHIGLGRRLFLVDPSAHDFWYGFRRLIKVL